VFDAARFQRATRLFGVTRLPTYAFVPGNDDDLVMFEAASRGQAVAGAISSAARP